MGITVHVTRDFDHMSRIGADIVIAETVAVLKKKKQAVLGLATGNSPTGLYKHFARAANEGKFDPGRIRSFNLDEYVGLPGDNVQQRVMHPESYAFFMIRELFGVLEKNFSETRVPYGALIDQKRLIKELKANREDWIAKGTNAGKSIVIKPDAGSEYLSWIRKEILNGYAKKIREAGGIDLQIIGVGGRGHVAFHESGIPFAGSKMMLVRLDDNTIANAVKDGHFEKESDSPRYAISMGAELVYRAKTVVLLASGERKTEAVTRSLLEEPTPEIPISYGLKYAAAGGNLVYVVDAPAGRELPARKNDLAKKGIRLVDRTQDRPRLPSAE